MPDLRLALACGPYDRTEALRAGTVRPEGIDLIYVPIQSPPEIFARMVATGSFDASEMSCSLYLIRKSQGDFPFVALPVFPSRAFRHGFIFVNTAAGIREPKDLEGRRVGVPEYSQTAAVWIRGLLAEDHGVDLDSIHWFTGGVNAPGRPPALRNVPTGRVSIEPVGDRSLGEMLAAGDIDALIGARRPEGLGRDARIKRLWPNYRELEREYYRQTSIFPIMHTVVLKEQIYREHPWVAQSLYKAFGQAKELSFKQMRFSGALRYALPWLQADLDEIDEVFGGDAWPYGLEANRKTLDTLLRYLSDQRLMHTPPVLDEVFAPITIVSE